MGVFENVDDGIKNRIVSIWQRMKESDKNHFSEQVSLVLSVWGEDNLGKKLVTNVLETLVNDNSVNLVDFGLYVDSLLGMKSLPADRIPRVKKAAIIMEGYRIKNNLSNDPTKDS